MVRLLVRRAEKCEHRVADEFIDQTSLLEDRAAYALEIIVGQIGEKFRVHGLGAFGEADEIREEDSDDLALLVHGMRYSDRQGDAAKRAERERPRQLLAATRADRHPPSLGHSVREARLSPAIMRRVAEATRTTAAALGFHTKDANLL